MAKQPTSSTKVSKIEGKLDLLCDRKEYYEAHQLYKTIFNRYNAQKKNVEAMKIIEKGTKTLLQAGQFESGTDLGIMFIGKLKEEKTPISTELLRAIEEIQRAYGLHQPCRDIFMKAAIKWTSMVDKECPQGHPDLHRLQARVCWQEHNFDQARHHFLYSNDFEGFGKMLVQWATEAENQKEEYEFFLALAILQLLVLQNTFGARAVYLIYTGLHPHYEGLSPPYKNSPFANYFWFLLELIESTKDVEVFHCLNDVYSKLLDWDPQYRKYLSQIGHHYFGIPRSESANSSPGNFLEGLFSAFSGNDAGGQDSEPGSGFSGLLQSLGSAFQGEPSNTPASTGATASQQPRGPPTSSHPMELD